MDYSNNFVDFVDFDSYSETDNLKASTNNKIYDIRTTEYYRILRMRKMDPIISVELDESKCFKFYDKWDPYTGERSDKDQDGPLCFHPDVLIQYFHVNRLNNLWVEPIDDNEGYHFQGYYDIAVGSGEDIFVQSRGFCPDKYLFRLPITDCYLTKDHNNNFITLGPKLTDDEIIEIERLANLYGDNYKNMFGKRRPSLSLMKKYYDQAISKNPVLENIDTAGLSEQKIQELKDKYNRFAVENLKKIK